MTSINEKLPKSNTARLEAFSDGAFAIALTLLILEIKIPKHEDLIQAGGLYNYILSLWPSYISYFLSGIFIGIYWANHHWLFGFVKKTDHFFNLLNILFLICVSFMPFTTAVIGDFVIEPEYRDAAVTTYCVGYILPVIAILFICLYAFHKKRLVSPNLSKKFMNGLIYKLLISLVCGTIAFCFSFFYLD